MHQPAMMFEETREVNKMTLASDRIDGDRTRQNVHVADVLEAQMFGAHDAAIGQPSAIHEDRRSGVVRQRQSEKEDEEQRGKEGASRHSVELREVDENRAPKHSRGGHREREHPSRPEDFQLRMRERALHKTRLVLCEKDRHLPRCARSKILIPQAFWQGLDRLPRQFRNGFCSRMVSPRSAPTDTQTTGMPHSSST